MSASITRSGAIKEGRLLTFDQIIIFRYSLPEQGMEVGIPLLAGYSESSHSRKSIQLVILLASRAVRVVIQLVPIRVVRIGLIPVARKGRTHGDINRRPRFRDWSGW